MTTYREVAEQIAELVETKQAAYGDSFGKAGSVMSILYPDGIPASKLEDALVVVRVLDKLFRIATDRDALGESPWRDILGYSLLAVTKAERQKAVAEDASPPQILDVDGTPLKTPEQFMADFERAAREAIAVRVRTETDAGSHTARYPRCNHWSPAGMPTGLQCEGLAGHSGQHVTTSDLNGRVDVYRWNS